MSLPIDRMLTDVRLAEEQLERLGAESGLVGDLCCHIKALAGEVERLRVGLGMIGQIIHGSTRVTRMIAEATLGGANLLDDDVAIDVCSGHWKPAPKLKEG
jgi:hypothetical protein